jgi:pectin methylesterase-like acyl-CoA thioesterase
VPGWLSRSLRARRHRSSVIHRASRRQLAAPLAALTVVTAVLASASAASAAPPPAYWGGAPQASYWVSSSGTAGAADTSCQTAGYSAIQTAVNAAEAAPAGHYGFPVPAIEICPGTYTEQLTITKSMTLTRAAGSPSGGPVTIELPAKIAESATNCQAKAGSIETQTVIEVCAAGPNGVNTSGTKVTIRDVTVEGNWTTEPDCNDNRYDIFVAGGASLPSPAPPWKRPDWPSR